MGGKCKIQGLSRRREGVSCRKGKWICESLTTLFLSVFLWFGELIRYLFKYFGAKYTINWMIISKLSKESSLIEAKKHSGGRDQGIC